jgi:regulator of sigma E protease
MEIPSLVYTLVSFAVALGLLIFVHELGHFMVAKRVGVRVLRFSIGFGPVVFSRVRGETEYAISALPLGGYVKMLGEDDVDEPAALEEPERSFEQQTLGKRAAIVVAGPLMNLVFAFAAYAVVFALFGVDKPANTPRVGGVVPAMAAEKAGLETDDLIVAIDGKPIDTWTGLSEAVLSSKGKTLELTVERDGRRFPLKVTPMLQENRNLFGEAGEQVYRIGIEAPHEWEEVGTLRAVGMAAEQTVSATFVVLKGFSLMIRGRVPLRELGGPIAIARTAGRQARAGFRYFAVTLAFLSVNLCVLNLLPIPGLDGGLLAFFGIEGLKGSPLRQRHREIAQQVGILVLITLMVFVFYNDIHRLVQG